MARIRSIKPEFPQSESIGRLSRDARLLFVQLWTFVDDEGRARAASRMLASLLYPYDDDAPTLIVGWLDELEREGCIRRYAVGDAHYLDIPNWLKHQKIDKPSKSKVPPFDEGSRIVAKPREASAPDLGSRTLDLGSRIPEANASADSPPSADTVPKPPAPQPELPIATQQDPETEFWKLGAALEKKGIPRSRMGQLVKLHNGDFASLLAIARDISRARNPSTYLGKILSNRRAEAAFDCARRARDGPPSGLPDFVLEAKAEGLHVEKEGRRWRIGSVIYDQRGEEVGW